jgi:hypothetical protein
MPLLPHLVFAFSWFGKTSCVLIMVLLRLRDLCVWWSRRLGLLDTLLVAATAAADGCGHDYPRGADGCGSGSKAAHTEVFKHVYADADNQWPWPAMQAAVQVCIWCPVTTIASRSEQQPDHRNSGKKDVSSYIEKSNEGVLKFVTSKGVIAVLFSPFHLAINTVEDYLPAVTSASRRFSQLLLKLNIVV